MLLKILIVAFVAGAVGTGIGGLLGIIIKRPKKRYIAAMLGLASGAMLGMALFEMLGEAASLGGVVPIIVGVGLGGIFVYVADCVMERRKDKKRGKKATALQCDIKLDEGTEQKRNLFKLGCAVFFAIMLHDLPEGIAIGASYHVRLGALIALTMLLHNIPEGMSIAVPLKAAGLKNYKILLISFLAGLPTLIGALIGYFLAINDIFIAYTLAFSAGIMISVVFSAMLKTAYEYTKSAHFVTVFIMLGVLMIIIFSSLLH